jgi:excisionase family DNA binding protein
MADIHDFPNVPGYVSIKQAAQMLGISNKRVYRYIELGRLPAYKSGGTFLLAEEDVRQFKLNPPGRTRTEPPPWRAYTTRSRVLATEIQAPVYVGQQQRLREKLAEIQQANRHTFPGTIARYLIEGDPALNSIHILLVWKDTEMPDEQGREQSLEALREELADSVDWQQACYATNEALLYT